MWLMHVETRKLEEFFHNSIPPYAILSHTWDVEEVSFQDLAIPAHVQKRGYSKIEGCCQQARNLGLSYVWVDTCCIDKTSSAELSEAINSMFAWYERSQVCFVYLEDVPLGDKPFDPDSAFRKTRWFQRGWTLQELLAPNRLAFYNSSWVPIFSRRDGPAASMSNWNTRSVYHQFGDARLPSLLSELTSIPKQVLSKGLSLSAVSMACKLSWAADRQTTRPEDLAYCLMGILQVNMPLLYGEGDKAFVRLQEIAMSKTDDISALAWGYGLNWDALASLGNGSVLATKPAAFRFYPPDNFRHMRHMPRTHTVMTGHGLQVELPMVCIDGPNAIWMGIVEEAPGSSYGHDHGIGIVLRQSGASRAVVFERALGCPPVRIQEFDFRRLWRQRGGSAMRTVYLQDSGVQNAISLIHVATGFKLMRFMWHRLRYGTKTAKSIRWIVSRSSEPPDVNELKWLRDRRGATIHGQNPLPPTLNPVSQHAEFVISIAQLEDRGFVLQSVYPPIGHGHLVQHRNLREHNSERRKLTQVLVCQGPANTEYISIFTKIPELHRREGGIALRFKIDWDAVSARRFQVSCMHFDEESAILLHSRTGADPTLKQLNQHRPNLKQWKNYVNMIERNSWHLFHIRTGSIEPRDVRSRASGTSDYILRVHEGHVYHETTMLPEE